MNGFVVALNVMQIGILNRAINTSDANKADDIWFDCGRAPLVRWRLSK